MNDALNSEVGKTKGDDDEDDDDDERHHGQKSWDERGTDGASLAANAANKNKRRHQLGYSTCCKLLPQPQYVDTGRIGYCWEEFT